MKLPLRLAILPHLLLALLLARDVRAADEARPNILFCFADDWGRYAGAYAATEARPSLNQIVKTPNLDRVAQRGVLFKNAFVGSPSCTPCRSAVLSGRYFFNTGQAAILSGAVWDPAIPSWPLLLRDAGYHIGKMFKVWGPGTPSDAPYGQQAHAFQNAGGEFNNFSENVTRMMQGGAMLADAREKMLGQVRGNFEQFLAARKAGEPWAFWFGPTTTHRTWIKGSGKALWGLEPETLKGKLPAFLPDVPEVREDVADYLGEAQAWDAYIGVLVQKLEETGELGRTLIVISGDHGMPGVTHGKCNLYDHGVHVGLLAAGPGIKGGRVVEDFIHMMEVAPTFLEAGGVQLPPGMNGRSFLEVLRSEKSGQVDATRTSVVTGRERHVGGAREENLPYPQRALRTADFLYIRNFKPERWPMGAPYGVTDSAAPEAAVLEQDTRAAFPDMDASPTKAWLIAHRHEAQWRPFYDMAFAKRPADELYDLRKDPDQTKNVAPDPAYAAQLREHRERLLKTLAAAGDPRVTGDGSTFDRPPFTNPEAGGGKRGARGK